jgi:hypothetical protein
MRNVRVTSFLFFKQPMDSHVGFSQERGWDMATCKSSTRAEETKMTFFVFLGVYLVTFSKGDKKS